jgi:hypothetical protein
VRIQTARELAGGQDAIERFLNWDLSYHAQVEHVVDDYAREVDDVDDDVVDD